MNETDGTTRELLGWALLFSIPVGVGVSMASMRMSRGALSDPVVVLPGVVAAVVVFAFVGFVGRGGDGAVES